MDANCGTRRGGRHVVDFRKIYLLKVLWCIIFVFPTKAVTGSTFMSSQNTDQHNYNSADEIMELLFQNRTNFLNAHDRKHLRQLGIVKDPYDPMKPVPCVLCRTLKYCEVVNTYMLQEVYYPKRIDLLESCKVLDSLGKRMSETVFGSQRTFRDTKECRSKIVRLLLMFSCTYSYEMF